MAKDALSRLAAIIKSRRHARPEDSHTRRLLDDGPIKPAKKLGEEAVEVAIAALAQDSGECATTVATLLGAAHAVRGCFDEGGLDAPAVRDAARARLGADEFEAAYERGRCLPRDDALALAASAVANPVTAS